MNPRSIVVGSPGVGEPGRRSTLGRGVSGAVVRGLVLIVGMAVGLAGCAVGPDYRRPADAAPAAFANGAGAGAVSNAAPVAEWWLAFQDSLMERLVVQASTNNHDVRRAEARLREARALWTEARFDYAPTVQGQARYDKTQKSKAVAGTGSRQVELYRAGFDATWELDLWGAVRRNVEAARATVESVEATRDDILVALQAEVAANYIEVRGTQARLEVATRNATNQARTLELAVALLNGGQGTRLDVARARTLLYETLASIPPLEANLHQAMYRVSVLCGLPPSALTNELLASSVFPRIPSIPALDRPGEVLRNRPDVRAAERSLAAATARIGVETADLFPRVTLTGSLAVEAGSVSGLSTPGAGAYNFGPHLTWAAFDLGRVRQRVKAADARAMQALAVYEQTVLLALEETENALVALARERQRSAHLAEAEKSAAEAVRLARQRYRDGISDYLSVLDAERTLLNVEEQFVTNQTLTVARLIAVFKALAGGVPPRTNAAGAP